jgi:hypothetical protein
MIVSIHQPNFLPWPGYFNKIVNSDIFVVIDNVQYVKGHIINRNKIKDNNAKASWLTVPVKISKGSEQLINEIEIDYSHKWQQKNLNRLKSYYEKSKFFDKYFPVLKQCFCKQYSNLADFNIELIQYICSELKINTPIYITSDLQEDFGERNYLNLNICKYFKADTYLSGIGARKYNDENLFRMNAIKLKYQEFTSPVYPQLHGEFIPNLSIVDLLLNCGSVEARKLLL